MSPSYFTLFLTIAVSHLWGAASESINTGTFAKFEFRTLKANVMAEKRVRSDMDCGFPCVRDDKCLSFNVATNPDHDGLLVCQLLETDKDNSPQLFTDSVEFHHFSRIKSPCDVRPCLNGGQCKEQTGVNGYICECAAGFMGVNCESVKWIKFNTAPVSIGAKDESYGEFNITKDGRLITIKLVYIEGYVTSVKSASNARSHWYNNDETSGNPLLELGILITDILKTIVLPKREDIPKIAMPKYTIPGYDSMSPEIVFKNLSTPRRVSVSEKFLIWYIQDYINAYESECDGTVKVDVYGLYF